MSRSNTGTLLDEDRALEILKLTEPSEALQAAVAPMTTTTTQESENGRHEHEGQIKPNPAASRDSNGERFTSEILELTEPSVAMTPPLVEEVNRDVFGAAGVASTTDAEDVPVDRGATIDVPQKKGDDVGTKPDTAKISEKSRTTNEAEASPAKSKSGSEKAVGGSAPDKHGKPKDVKLKSEGPAKVIKKEEKQGGSSKRQLYSKPADDDAKKEQSSKSNLKPGAISVAGVDPVTGQPASESPIMNADVELATPASSAAAAARGASTSEEKPQDTVSGSFVPATSSTTEQSVLPAYGELATAKALNSSEFEEEIRNRILSETVRAQVEPNDQIKKDGRKRRRRTWIMVIAALVVSAGIVVGVTAGVLLSGQKAHGQQPMNATRGETVSIEDTEEAVRLYLDSHGGSFLRGLEEALANASSRQRAAFDYIVNSVQAQQITTAAVPETFALANIYLGMGGPTWMNATGWMSHDDPNVCNWYGIRCSGTNNQVTELNLNHNNISGTFVDEIYLLSNVQKFNMADNTIWDGLPHEFHGLTAITHINLSSNLITGNIPSFLRRLEDWIEDIDLSQNSFSGPVDGDIFTGSFELTNLDISHNQLDSHLFTEDIRESIANETFREDNLILHKLRHLNLEANRFTGEVPYWVGYLSNLEVAQFDSNFFSGTMPTVLCDRVESGLDLIVDCNRVDCGACGCTCGIGAPTFSPTITARPTITGEPTRSPTSRRGMMRPPG